MDLKLTKRVALITGSTAGIGLRIARSLACEGADVYVNGGKQERVDAAIATPASSPMEPKQPKVCDRLRCLWSGLNVSLRRDEGPWRLVSL